MENPRAKEIIEKIVSKIPEIRSMILNLEVGKVKIPTLYLSGDFLYLNGREFQPFSPPMAVQMPKVDSTVDGDVSRAISLK